MALFGRFFRRKPAEAPERTADPPAQPPPGQPVPAPAAELAPRAAPEILQLEPTPAPDLIAEVAQEPPARQGLFARLRQGLSRTAEKLSGGIGQLFTRRKLDEAALEDLSDLLLSADLGVAASERIIAGFRSTRFGREVTEREVREALAAEIAEILAPVAVPLVPEPSRAPWVVLVVGVNGTGKTTTIAKLAAQWGAQGLSCMLAACDTFRAAAVEQLKVWGERTGAPVVAGAPGADAAGLAYEALETAQAQGADVLLIDTAGRLHNKANLMAELAKVIRVLKKRDETAPHAVLLVLDATTGQNAVQQAKVFREITNVTGLVVTKLDGSAKGGVVVALAQEFGLPVHAVGVGEKALDLRPFEPRAFAQSLVGVEEIP
ncbi:MAG: signal recognition particle-docking protein FtsY [Acetobacteraceae bacterium]|nr:signal recognition particle-docking protein FtsY [Acetobacteraceae bacterium]